MFREALSALVRIDSYLRFDARIIVGVKYCFRYNQRNRQLRNEETGEPIDLVTLPRTHRRRREKKLMTMDEVNSRFPLTKYKAWRSTRANASIPTAEVISTADSSLHSPNIKNGTLVVDTSVSPSLVKSASTDSQRQMGPTIRKLQQSHRMLEHNSLSWTKSPMVVQFLLIAFMLETFRSTPTMR